MQLCVKRERPVRISWSVVTTRERPEGGAGGQNVSHKYKRKPVSVDESDIKTEKINIARAEKQAEWIIFAASLKLRDDLRSESEVMKGKRDRIENKNNKNKMSPYTGRKKMPLRHKDENQVWF